MQTIDQFLTQLTHAPPPACEIRSHFMLPPAPYETRALPARFPSWLIEMLQAQTITSLTEGQWQALDRLQQGQHLYFAAPSGRNMVRSLAMFQSIGIDRRGYSLFIFPYKHREQAQLQTLLAWNDHLAPEQQLSAAIYDGDTPVTQRRAIRQTLPHVVLTTPEMLHAGILAYHSGWRALFQALRYVVLTDLHLCAGALATHLCHLLRRLHRLALHYGSQPQYLLTSPPVAHPEEVARNLTGQTCHTILGEAWRPQEQHRVLIHTTRDVRSTGNDILSRLRDAQLASVLLTASPLSPFPTTSAEAAEADQDVELHLLRGEETVVTLPRETPVGVIRTGVVRSMVCLGLPSSLTQLHTWLAFVGHRPTPSMSILVLDGSTPLERYLLHDPDAYQTSGLQGFPIALHNSHVLQHHLLCAAAELALKSGERYAGIYNLSHPVRQLAANREIRRRAASREWTATERRPHRRIRLRWLERPFALINRQDTSRLGWLAPDRALRECFEGAHYIHDDGRIFHVERVDDDRHRVMVQPSQETDLTRSRLHTTVANKRLEAAIMRASYRVSYGVLDYTEAVQAFERLNAMTYTRQSVHMLSGKQRYIRTSGIWLDFPHQSVAWHARMRTAFHTVVHAILAAIPLLFQSEPHDCRGGIYTPDGDADAGLEAVLADSHAGGNGMSASIYQAHTQVFSAALMLLQQCDCRHGCHYCMAVRCETCTETDRLDREAGINLLQQMLGVTVATPDQMRHHTPKHLYLCLTTQKAADDVGGWQHRHLLGLGVAMTYDTADSAYRVYTEETVEQLFASLCHANQVIGFNTRDFDYQVLQPYTDIPLPTLPTCAMLDDIQQALGYRLNLRHLVQETLGIDRPDDRLQTVTWYQEGNTERLINLCRRDIDLIRELVRYGTTTGALRYRDRMGESDSIPINWTFADAYG